MSTKSCTCVEHKGGTITNDTVRVAAECHCRGRQRDGSENRDNILESKNKHSATLIRTVRRKGIKLTTPSIVEYGIRREI
jgi:hypothetical protein